MSEEKREMEKDKSPEATKNEGRRWARIAIRNDSARRLRCMYLLRNAVNREVCLRGCPPAITGEVGIRGGVSKEDWPTGVLL